VTLHAALSLACSHGNFYAEKQRSNKVLPFGLGGPVIVRHRVVSSFLAFARLLFILYTAVISSFDVLARNKFSRNHETNCL